jgi:hypothetical protein
LEGATLLSRLDVALNVAVPSSTLALAPLVFMMLGVIGELLGDESSSLLAPFGEVLRASSSPKDDGITLSSQRAV